MAALGGVVLGAVLGAVLTYFFNTRQQARLVRDRWAVTTSEALADVEMFLTATFPPVALQTLGPDSVLMLKADSEKVRRAVAVLGAGHPDSAVRKLAVSLEAALYNTMSLVEVIIHVKHPSGGTDPDRMTEARRYHEEARDLARQITDRIHA